MIAMTVPEEPEGRPPERDQGRSEGEPRPGVSASGAKRRHGRADVAVGVAVLIATIILAGVRPGEALFLLPLAIASLLLIRVGTKIARG